MVPRLVGGLVGAIERKITGATAMLTEFSPKDTPGVVSMSGVMPGKIKAIELEEGEVGHRRALCLSRSGGFCKVYYTDSKFGCRILWWRRSCSSEI